MENNHIVQAVAQNMPPWLGVAVGHLASSTSLSNIALFTSIVYSVVNIWSHLRKRKGDED